MQFLRIQKWIFDNNFQILEMIMFVWLLSEMANLLFQLV